MWTCSECGRIFEKTKQPHSCQKVSLEEHFKNKDKAKEIFNYLVGKINSKVGKCRIISLPCCIHLFGSYDFLAALPKKGKLEIRFGLDSKLNSSRLRVSLPISEKNIKNCIVINNIEEIDEELMGWLGQAYHLKDR
jgi:hypothetical protein